MLGRAGPAKSRSLISFPVASFVSRFIFRMRRATPFACNRSTISHKCRPERAKAKAEGKYRGGIPTARAKAEQVFAVVDAGKTRGKAAEELGISIQSVFRILRTRKDAEKAVTRIRTRPRVSAS